jgi:undecaprenyl-diphosphatase
MPLTALSAGTSEEGWPDRRRREDMTDTRPGAELAESRPLISRLLGSARREWPILLTLLLAAGAFWTFIEVADEVTEGSTAAVDRAILLMLRDSADPRLMAGPGWLQEVMRDFTGLGGYGILTLATVAATGFLCLEHKWHAAVLLLVAVLGGMLLSTLLKAGFDRPRPDLVPHGSIVSSASFPSGHSMLSAVVYLTLGALIARFRSDPGVRVYILGLSIFVTFLVGVSRVYLGVHWPTDVLAGWALGAAWALLCWFVALLLQMRGDVEQN